MCGTVQNQNCSFFVVILDNNFASIINCKWRHSNISMHVQFKKYTVEIYEMASLQRIYFIMADTPSCLTCLTHTHCSMITGVLYIWRPYKWGWASLSSCDQIRFCTHHPPPCIYSTAGAKGRVQFHYTFLHLCISICFHSIQTRSVFCSW